MIINPFEFIHVITLEVQFGSTIIEIILIWGGSQIKFYTPGGGPEKTFQPLR